MKLSFLSMFSYDGVAPPLEIWPVASKTCDPAIGRASYKRWIGLAQHAEALGFDWVSVAEHHYAAYMMTPNPIVAAGALSQALKKATIALLGPLIPLNNPVRLAEEIAMLDTLSEGRLAVMFLRGTENEHNTYDTPKGATREMTQEGIDLAIKALTTDDPFSWHGTHYNFSTVSVWPKSNGGFPIYGSGNSEESVEFAASRRLGIGFSFCPPETVKKFVALYKQRAAAAGWTPTAEHILYRGLAYLSDTDEHAREETQAFFGAKAAASMDAAANAQASMGGPQTTPLILEPFFLGSAKTVIDRFAALRECGVGVVDMGFTIGTHEQQIGAMNRFARDVMPTVKAW